MTSVRVAEHGWVCLIAVIDCGAREIVARQLETRCRAREAIALIERAAPERGILPGTLTLGTDNGAAFTPRAFKTALARLRIAHRRQASGSFWPASAGRADWSRGRPLLGSSAGGAWQREMTGPSAMRSKSQRCALGERCWRHRRR
jgi:transposase InsO family protein